MKREIQLGTGISWRSFPQSAARLKSTATRIEGDPRIEMTRNGRVPAVRIRTLWSVPPVRDAFLNQSAPTRLYVSVLTAME